MSGGRRAGVAAARGVAVGRVVHTLLAALGLSARLRTSDTAFRAVPLAGAGDPAILGVRLPQSRPAPAAAGQVHDAGG